ncbi:MAG: lipid-A-disaccharide synthase [Candidatus Riflebacteria bacterium]|nr:lipid-A-disaccharide synthase [Candidatus Riflebacteria bacterium]
MSSSNPHIFLLAGEFSGNLYGAALARELRKLSPRLRLSGVGGSQMADAGVHLVRDSSTWGGIGLVESLKRCHLVWVYRQLVRQLTWDKPDVLVLIDYPGFNMPIARFAKSVGIPTLYYFPPGKFTDSADSIRDAARTITRVAAPFELTYVRYREAQASVEFVGHPLFDVVKTEIDRDRIRADFAIKPNQRIIGLLPGSRRQEIRMHTPILAECARQIALVYPEARFIVPVVNCNLREYGDFVQNTVSRHLRHYGIPVDVTVDRTYDVMAVSDLLVVCSGTATLEAAYYEAPMIVTYRTSLMTEILARLFYPSMPPYVGLPNILAQRMIVPEFIQQDFIPENVIRECRDILDNQQRVAQIRADLRAVVDKLGPRGATERVARMALDLVG